VRRLKGLSRNGSERAKKNGNKKKERVGERFDLDEVGGKEEKGEREKN